MRNPNEDQLDALMSAYAGAVPGAALTVRHAGVTLLQRSYGCAELESGRAVSAVTNFRLASLSKQFTAAAVLLLVEDGALSLDDGVRRWLPSLPACAEDATLRHLLTHSAGLIDFEEAMPADVAAPLHDADVLRLLESANRRYFPPGSSYRYSNSGYVLLALVVERASRMRYGAFLRERIFGPLGMRHSLAYEAGGSVVENRAYGYSLEAGRWIRTDQSLTSATLGDGGVYSSSDDLARWDEALAAGGLLKAASIRAAFSAAIATGVAGVHYGFGWRVSGNVVWHSGETVGFRNVFLRYLEPRLSVVLLTNRGSPSPHAAALAVARLYLGAAGDAGGVPADDTPAGPDPSAHPRPP
jgi:CubicO group peptidase (beta-lactamase class C family)